MNINIINRKAMKETKTDIVIMRLTPSEKKKLREEAFKKRLSITDFLMKAASEFAKSSQVPQAA
jgi:uncharacterized protein (DUF1778 family)